MQKKIAMSCIIIVFGLGLISRASLASEVIVYNYDVLGRLILMSHSGSVNDGVVNGMTYDVAENRVSYVSASATISVADSSVARGGVESFSVTRSRALTNASTVSYSSADFTALAGTDYVATSGVLTFAAGEISKTIAVQTMQNPAGGTSKKFYLKLSAASSDVIINKGIAAGNVIY